MLKRSILTIIIGALLIIGSCKKSSDIYRTLSKEEIDAIIAEIQSLPEIPVAENEKAVIKTNMGTIEFEFYPDVAPNHCANFKKLANCGFYDGITFHRVIPGFMIQTGDILSRDNNPANDGSGGIGYTINAEFSALHHDRGIVSTARKGGDINSAGSQFFICVAAKHYLDGQYTIFGKVTKGMDVVDKIVNVKRDSRDRPLKNVVMENVRVVNK